MSALALKEEVFMDENQKFDEKVRLGAILGSDIKNFLKFNKKDNQDSADYIREAI